MERKLLDLASTFAFPSPSFPLFLLLCCARSQHLLFNAFLFRAIYDFSLVFGIMQPFLLGRLTAVSSEAWAKLREWAILAGKGRLLLSGSVVLASLKAAVKGTQ